MRCRLSLALVPGGATEALYSHPSRDVVYLRKRGGFVKLALETGAHLLPVFSFVRGAVCAPGGGCFVS